MKITRIHHLKSYRIFKDFSWPADGLPDFGRFNLVYGWNGSGKTALSNLFRHVQNKTPLLEGDAEIVVDQTRVPGSAFATTALPNVRVFNRDTVSRNVFEAPNEQLPPVFFLGEDSVEKQKRIEELKKEATKLSSTQLRLEGKLTTASNSLDTYCTDQARAIKNLLTVAGGGPYNNYDARDFKSAAQRIAATDPPLLPLTAEHREKHLATKDGKSMAKIEPLSIAYPEFGALTSRTGTALGKKVISRVIAELSENPSVASWVGEGIGLHTGPQASKKCRFCDQVLPVDRLQHLEAHFNDEFKRIQNELDTLISDISAAKATIDDLRLPVKAEFYSHLQNQYERETSTLSPQRDLVRVYFDALLKALHAKKSEPFKAIDLLPFFTRDSLAGEPVGTLEKVLQVVLAGTSGIAGLLGKAACDRVNALILNHNQYTDNFDEEVRQSRNALAQDEVLKALPDWQSKVQAVGAATEALQAARQRGMAIQVEITEFEKHVLQHRRPAEELNREMADYLGRDELRFEVEQTGYRISRNGNHATHLSEGERTAIAFMYFLKSLEANDFDVKSGIVVIDDPVSSLDANSLYSAFGFMKQQTATAGQLFVLTHNFTLFRQVRNWFYHLRGPDKRSWRMYMLNTIYIDGKRAATIEPLDPFLHQYESEYHYLFKRVHVEAQRPLGQGLESYYSTPNLARRLLESFLAFRVPDVAGELSHKLDSIPYDTVKKTRILRFLHTYSHSDQVMEPGHDPSLLSEAPAIMKDVLALIRETDETHHDRMVVLISPPAEADH